jgi:hypothetical protein
MKPILLALLMLGAPLGYAADSPPLTFYVQLIRGTDSDSPPTADAHLVGAKLDHRLHDVFRWKNYWEVKRETISISPGQTVRQHITLEREVELTVPASGKMTVSIYANGKMTRKRTQPVDAAFYIAGGGDNDGSQPWFIVVRRDNPDSQGLAAMP